MNHNLPAGVTLADIEAAAGDGRERNRPANTCRNCWDCGYSTAPVAGYDLCPDCMSNLWDEVRDLRQRNKALVRLVGERERERDEALLQLAEGRQRIEVLSKAVAA